MKNLSGVSVETVLPSEGPKIWGSQRSTNKVGDVISVNCTSPKSKPSATLRWHVNETPIDSSKGHNGYDTTFSSQSDSDSLEVSSLALRFTLSDKHFNNGVLRLRCTASIGLMYNMRNEILISSQAQDELEKSLSSYGLSASENLSQGNVFVHLLLAPSLLSLVYLLHLLYLFMCKLHPVTCLLLYLLHLSHSV